MSACDPSLSGSPQSPTLRTMFTPGVSVGTRNIDIPLYGLTSVFVTAMTMRNDAVLAFEEKYFQPLMTHSSPSFSARVVNRVGSAPACGSVIEYDENISPLRRGWRYFAFCSSVP